jgi:glycosyltransferase involved in cell wall biosynthesis
MIVKNEAHVIKRCLDSLKGFIDHWVIVDTGSSDGTQDVIREHLKELPGELFERPWVNFAHNRSEALLYARGKADYVFVIDADEVLEFEEGLTLPLLDKDAYHFNIVSGGFAYYKTQLVNNKLEWCFKNVVHEYIYAPEAKSDDILPGVKTIRHPDGARSRDHNTYRKDALMLESALLDEPDNSRYIFYLAQSYRDANEPELAIKNYRKRIEMGGWDEEVWYSLYQIAEIKHRMGANWAEVLDAYLKAYQYKPNRAGPLYKIGIRYQWEKSFRLAYLFLHQAMAIPYPQQDRLFVEKSIYDYLLPLEYSVCCFYVGEHARSIEVNNSLLCNVDVPPNLIEQVLANRKFSMDALYPKVANPSRLNNRIKVCVHFHNPGPHLDNCIESLLGQDYQSFELIFIDDGSAGNYAEKIPLEDERVTLIRNQTQQGWAACLNEYLTRHGEPSDIIFPLDGANWLAGKETLTLVNDFFNDYECAVMYGQYRYSSGHLGLTMPLSGPAALKSLRDSWQTFSPLIFRCGLNREIVAADPELSCLKNARGEWMVETAENALNYALLEKAGFNRARFNDDVLTVLNLESRNMQAGDIQEPEAESLAAQLKHNGLVPA